VPCPGFKKTSFSELALESTLPPHGDGAARRVSERISDLLYSSFRPSARAADRLVVRKVNENSPDRPNRNGRRGAPKCTQRQGIWGDLALVLGIVAFVLILPTWPARSKSEATHGILTATPEENIWIEYFLQCIFRAGIILFGAFVLAVMVPIAANFLHILLSTR